MSFLAELLEFLKSRGKLWLWPPILLLLLFGGLLVISQASAIAPFIYTIF